MLFLQLAFASLGLSLLAGTSLGQEDESEGYTSGMVTLKPSIGLHILRNDNIYTTPNSAVSSQVLVQSPALTVEINPGRHKFEFEYQGEFGQFEKDSENDYTDSLLRAFASFDLGTRHELDLSASLVDDHEDRGSGLSRAAAPGTGGFPPRPDEFNDRNASATYRFGAADATGRIELGLATTDREYENNRNRTSVFDRSESSAMGAFFYRVRPGVDLVLDAQAKDIEYDEERIGQPGRDGQQLRLRAGVTWEPTGQTRGRIRVGRIEKEFDDPGRSTFSGISWQADLRWSPRSYSHIDLLTSREPVETIGDGDFMDSRTHRLTWSHEWSDLWESRIGFRIRDEDFVGIDRKEEMTEWSFNLDYRLRRWVFLQFGVALQSTDASQESLEYDQTIFQLGVRLAP